MKTQALEPAHLRFDADGNLPPSAPEFLSHHHAPQAALERARQVFIGGNGLPKRWQQRPRFVILEAGFGLGHNFLATWDAWRRDAQRCERLHMVAIERHPPLVADLQRAHSNSPLPELAAQLLQAWPALTPNLHTLTFEGGRLTLLLALGDVAALLPALQLRADAIYLDGFAPQHNPAMWQLRVLKALGRAAAPGATLATWAADRSVREDLATAGFVLDGAGGDSGATAAGTAPTTAATTAAATAAATVTAPASGAHDGITTARYQAHHQPRHRRMAGAASTDHHAAPRTAVVVGAGLAGAAMARALSAQGLQVTVLEAAAAPASQASGQMAGLFHGTVNADDSRHARLHRAAALRAAGVYAEALAAGVPGQLNGLLRLELREGGLPLMHTWLQRHRWPADYVQALSPEQASALAGLALPAPAWFYPRGGWISPPAWVAHALAAPGVDLRLNQAAAAIHRCAAGWQVLGASGQLLAQADLLVLAHAQAAGRLLQHLGHPAWPLVHTRGQVSTRSAVPGFTLKLPLAGDGYALPLPAQLGGGLLFGATSETGEPAGDDLPPVTDAAHQHNLQRLQRLTGLPAPPPDTPLQGRAAWRLNTADRLPIAGAVPLVHWPADHRQDQVRLLPREPGLFVLTALGARGLTLAPLLAELVAAQACGLPWPVEQDLADAVDPGRWRVRAARLQA